MEWITRSRKGSQPLIGRIPGGVGRGRVFGLKALMGLGYMKGAGGSSRVVRTSIGGGSVKFSFNRSWLKGGFIYLCSPFFTPKVCESA